MGTRMFKDVQIQNGNSSYLEEYENELRSASKVLGVLREVEVFLNRVRSIESKESSLNRESLLLSNKVKELINDFI